MDVVMTLAWLAGTWLGVVIVWRFLRWAVR
jgi:hypothetical protein